MKALLIVLLVLAALILLSRFKVGLIKGYEDSRTPEQRQEDARRSLLRTRRQAEESGLAWVDEDGTLRRFDGPGGPE